MKIKGKVTDKQTGEPLLMANVAVVGSTVGTTTDTDGDYSLDIDGPAEIGFSYVGYATQTFTPSQSCTHNVALVPTTVDLKEVTITGKRVTWWERNRLWVIAAACALAVVAAVAAVVATACR